MINSEQLGTLELLQLAEKVGMFDSGLTLNCIHCKAIFPKEYEFCPKCKLNKK